MTTTTDAPTLKVGALFAGYGGLDLAVESVIDSEVAWVAEWDDGPSRILAHRFPDAPNYRDVTAVKWAPDCPACGAGMGVYRPRGAATGPGAFYYCPPCDRQWDLKVRLDDPEADRIPDPVDVITGGSPCQDLSHAGKRAGMKDGTRSGLWASMCEAIETMRPALVVWENVRGALSAEATAGDVESCDFCVGDPGEPPLRALGRVLGDLAELGYDAAWAGLRAADVGAPHGRWRIFVLAWPADAEGDPWRLVDGDGGAARRPVTAGALLPTPEAKLGSSGPDYARATRPGTGGDSLHEAVGRLVGDGPLLPTPVVNDMGRAYTPESWDEWTDRLKASHGNGNGHGPSLHIEALRMLPTPKAGDATTGVTAATSGRPLDKSTHLTTAVNLLPTPRATDGSKGGPNQRGSSGDLMLPSAVHLLPTPTMWQQGGTPDTDPRNLLPLTVQRLMPTPTAADAGMSGGAVGSSSVTLTDATVRTERRGIDFGDYAPAIERWAAVLARVAPMPTEPTGKDGAQRLATRFVEWMMGLPDGWVTDPAIWHGMKVSTARNAQLKALGNGVVPQQAAAALRHLLGVRALAFGDAA